VRIYASKSLIYGKENSESPGIDMYGGLSRLIFNNAAVFYVLAFLTVLFGMRNLKNEENFYIEEIQYAVASVEDWTTTMKTETFFSTAKIATTPISTTKTTTRKTSNSTALTIDSDTEFSSNDNLPLSQIQPSAENITAVPFIRQKSQADTKIFKRANSMYEKCESIYDERQKKWESQKFCREDSGYRKSFESKKN
jgi:hypothetical protein